MILKVVFLLSISSLAFEIILTRVFSISQWNHLAFMVISIALFGFAASGTFLGLLDRSAVAWEKRLSTTANLSLFILLYTFSTIIAFVTLNMIPLDYFKLPLQPMQLFYLGSVFLLLALPFFFTGLTVSLAYSRLPERSGFVYLASMSGSAIGAILPALLLPVLGEGKSIIACAILPLLGYILLVGTGALQALINSRRTPEPMFSAPWKSITPATASLLILFFWLWNIDQKSLDVQPSQYKALSQLLQFPNTEIMHTHNGIRGRIDAVQSPYIRFAPGLSLKFSGVLPRQWSAYRDGDHPHVFYDLKSEKSTAFSKYTLPYAAYYYAGRIASKILLIQNGGGTGVPLALTSGAQSITILEQNPHISRFIQNQYRCRVINANPRAYLARNGQKFDVIHIENWGTSIPGTAVLSQDYLFTREAFGAYLNHLSPTGILVISRKLRLPPSDALRLWATAYESLRLAGVLNPEYHMLMLRNWEAFTLLLAPHSKINAERLRQFAEKLNFDLVYFHGMTQDLANRFNVNRQPFHFTALQQLARAYRLKTENRFFRDYLLDVAPQSDDRPFPARFLKWFNLEEIHKSQGSRLYALLMSGEIVVAVVLLEAFLISLFLLVLPLIISAKGKKPSFANILFFFAVGSGFMFVELFFIKKYTLLFGDPIISFTVVLAGLLVFSSAGGYWSQRLTPRALAISLGLLFIFIVLLTMSIDGIVHQVLKLPNGFIYVLALLLLMPLGFLLGIPFPLGMRYLLEYPVHRAYAWTANGCASVLMAVSSVLIALTMGITKILFWAALAYLLALLCVWRRRN